MHKQKSAKQVHRLLKVELLTEKKQIHYSKSCFSGVNNSVGYSVGGELLMTFFFSLFFLFFSYFFYILWHIQYFSEIFIPLGTN